MAYGCRTTGELFAIGEIAGEGVTSPRMAERLQKLARRAVRKGLLTLSGYQSLIDGFRAEDTERDRSSYEDGY